MGLGLLLRAGILLREPLKVFRALKVLKVFKDPKVFNVIRQKKKKGALAAPLDRSWNTLNVDAVLRPVEPCSLRAGHNWN